MHGYNSFLCAIWLIRIDTTNSRLRCNSEYDWFTSAIRLIHMCDMTPSYAWYNWFTCAIILIRTCDLTHSNVCPVTVDPPDLLSGRYSESREQRTTPNWTELNSTQLNVSSWVISEVWFMHMCGATHSYVRCNAFICVTWLIRMWGVTYAYVSTLHFLCANPHAY